MPRICKRGPGDDDLGQVVVIDDNDATETVERFKFEVTAKTRENVRRVKTPTRYGEGRPETVDNGGICAGETLVLQTRFAVVHGRTVQPGPDHVPKHVADALHQEGAEEVRA